MQIQVLQPSVFPRERYVVLVNGQELASGAQRADLKVGISRVDLHAPAGDLLVSIEDHSGLASPLFRFLFANGAALEYRRTELIRGTWVVLRAASAVLVQHNHYRLQSLWQGERQVGLLEHTRPIPRGPDHYMLRASNEVSAVLLAALVVAYDFYTTEGGYHLAGFLPSRRPRGQSWKPSEFGAPNLSPPAA